MKSIELNLKIHKGIKVIAISFNKDDEIEAYLKKFPSVLWSTTLKDFYVLDNTRNRKELFDYLRLKNWLVDCSSFIKAKSTPKINTNTALKLPQLSEELKTDVAKFKKWLEQKRLSFNTVKTYISVTEFFLRYAVLKKTDNYTVKLIEAFNYDFIFVAKKSISYQNQFINGIKKYFEYKNIVFGEFDIVRPKKERKLPSVLSTTEIKMIFGNTKNLKHRTLLSLLYSGGLRIGEAINLKVTDIDSKRMLIHVKQAKGKKDRYTLLSENFLLLLREYYKLYKPKTYLFEGQNNLQYSNSSAQAVLRKIVKKTTIKKKITLHSLRHSFATHLLENGTDIRYIQELLGHSSPKTTMIYTHVTQSSLKNIKNPFDDL